MAKSVVVALLGLACIGCNAQYADYTGKNRLKGAASTPSTGSGVGGAGATLLPYSVPAGTYKNIASYSLYVNVVPEGRCFDERVYVDGAMAGRVRDDCTSAATSAAVIVPPGSSINWTRFNATVTAFASGATWDQVGFRFQIGKTFVETSRVNVACWDGFKVDIYGYDQRQYNIGPGDNSGVYLARTDQNTCNDGSGGFGLAPLVPDTDYAQLRHRPTLRYLVA